MGGVLLGEALEHHDDEERQEAYDQGQLNLLVSHSLTLTLVAHIAGYDNGQDGGDYDGGGGDW